MLRKRIMNVVGILLIIILVGLLIYSQFLSSEKKKEEKAAESKTVIQTLLSRDLENQYPETHRELLEYFSKVTQEMYSNANDDEVEQLAKKVLILFDSELLEKNPEETYLKNLYTDIAAWQDKNRRITNFVFVNKEEEKVDTIDGVEYATVQVTYTIEEKGKVSEVRKYMLRKNEANQWKILGWDSSLKTME